MGDPTFLRRRTGVRYWNDPLTSAYMCCGCMVDVLWINGLLPSFASFSLMPTFCFLRLLLLYLFLLGLYLFYFPSFPPFPLLLNLCFFMYYFFSVSCVFLSSLAILFVY